MSPIIIQIIGFLGLGCFLVSYQFRETKPLFIMQMIACSLFAVQFLLLEQPSGAVSLLMSIIRNFPLVRRDKWPWVKWKGLVVIFIALYAAYVVWQWNSWIDILPLIGFSAGTVAYSTFNARNIRISNLFISSPVWIVYDSIVGSIGGVINEAITIISVLVSIWRFGWKALGESENKN